MRRRGMTDEGRSARWRGTLAIAAASALLAIGGWIGTGRAEPPAPTGGAPENAPRSRLTLRGEYTTDTYIQKHFYLGAPGPLNTGVSSDFDAFWTQRLVLYPRLILADNLNVTTRVNVAQGIWGIDNDAADSDATGYTGIYGDKGTFAEIQLDWAYLSYLNRRTATRWYIGRQRFELGHLLVLDTDATGIQVYRDFSQWGSSLGFGFAKLSEGTDGVSDRDANTAEDETTRPDGRDADLYFLQWQRQGERFHFNPFYAYYLDRSMADGSSYLPDGLGYMGARFQPNVTRASVLGLSVAGQMGRLGFDLEINQLSGVDRLRNEDSGPFELYDRNSGDLRGSNVYFRAALQGGRFELGGIFAQGSGDADVRSGEGNINRLVTDGYFYITEVWEDSIMPTQVGLNPDGLGSPLARGYRELENTRILQGFLAFHLRQNLRLFASVSMIRATQDVPSWFDENGDGVLEPSEIGARVSNELGSEFDWRVDWSMENKMLLTFRGGYFLPRAGAGFLINGTDEFSVSALEMRVTLTVPISEFSLGG